MKVGILGNVNKVKNAQTMEAIAEFLKESGYEIVRFKELFNVAFRPHTSPRASRHKALVSIVRIV